MLIVDVSAGGYRPPAPARYAAPNAHGGPAVPPRPRGQYPANYGRAEVAQPSGGYGNRNGNLYQAPVMFPGCYNCGDPSHRARECPTRPDRPTTPAPKVAAPRQPDVRPMKRRSEQAVAFRPETLSVQSTRKSYILAQLYSVFEVFQSNLCENEKHT